MFYSSFSRPFLYQKNIQTNQTKIYESENQFMIQIDAPGFHASDIAIDLEDNILTIKGSNTTNIPKEFGENQNSKRYICEKFRLKRKLDTENIEAKLENGILVLTLTKSNKSKVSIEVS